MNTQTCMGSDMPRAWQTPEQGCLQSLTWAMAKAGKGSGAGASSQSQTATGEWGTEVCCGKCARRMFPHP